MLGSACSKAPKACGQIVRDIDRATATAIAQDKLDLTKLRDELAGLQVNATKSIRRGAKIKRAKRCIVGKEKVIIAEARKVDLLYSLLATRKRKMRTYGRKVIGVSIWD